MQVLTLPVSLVVRVFCLVGLPSALCVLNWTPLRSIIWFGVLGRTVLVGVRLTGVLSNLVTWAVIGVSESLVPILFPGWFRRVMIIGPVFVVSSLPSAGSVVRTCLLLATRLLVSGMPRLRCINIEVLRRLRLSRACTACSS